MTQKYAVLTVSGQSNAVGYDESPVYEVGGYAPHPRLKQLGLYDEHNLTIIPLTYSPEDVQDMRAFSHPATPDKPGTKGIHLPLGHLLLEQLPADYQLLVIPVAYGGTYFGSEEHGLGTYDPEQMRDVRHSPKLRWGVQSSYYKMLRDRLEYALNLHPDNVYLGNVWIQGESDAANHTVRAQWEGFKELVDDFVQYFDQHFPERIGAISYRDVWLNVESTHYWRELDSYQEILTHYRQLQPETYVAIPATTDTNQFAGTGATTDTLTAHFGNNAYETVIAPRVYAQMRAAGVFDRLFE
ncbi:hypothetical protein [Dolosigranulum pigrum]|uniref:hypothetical protein n=2 Tax=Dolosigranulum pigrum TaxID=29394 RepID=UPI001AD8656D|nr:hypothetical protein [Dolosigranulum pigrum]QTJ37005.1 hypothetical protein FE323_08675 [Dolosigranulum pigrum]